MPRGRQYYDPIVQAPSRVESAADRRIELFPEQDVRDNTVTLRWVGRLIDERGVILEKSQGSFDHDDALRQAQELWPNLEVFELREESEDSTHEGMGPSPRLWQGSSPGDADGVSRQVPPQGPFPEDVGASPGPGDDQTPPVVDVHLPFPPPTAAELTDQQKTLIMEAGHRIGAGDQSPEELLLHVLPISEPGMYVRMGDVLSLLHLWETQYEDEKNPSAAMALREAREALATAYEGEQNG